MAIPAKELMDAFQEGADLARSADDFELSNVFETAVSAINNIAHGQPVAELIATARPYLTSLAEDTFNSEKENFGYKYVLELFEDFATIYQHGDR